MTTNDETLAQNTFIRISKCAVVCTYIRQRCISILLQYCLLYLLKYLFYILQTCSSYQMFCNIFSLLSTRKSCNFVHKQKSTTIPALHKEDSFISSTINTFTVINGVANSAIRSALYTVRSFKIQANKLMSL